MKGDEVKRRRKALGWTQEELGEKVGAVQSAISALERGGPIGDDLMAKIEAALSGAPAPRPRAAQENAMPPAHEDTALEHAVGAAFVPGRHMLRDANAVMAAFGGSPLPKTTDHELLALCRQWLDAAASLRTQGLPVTPQTLATQSALMAARAAPTAPAAPPDEAPDEGHGSQKRRRFG